MKRHEAKIATLYVAHAGAELTCVTPDGEIEWTVGFQPGIHKLDKLADHMSEGDKLELGGAATIRLKTGRVLAQKYGRHGVETGANPDFQPGRASEAEHAARLLLRKINAQSKALDKRIASFQRVAETRKLEGEEHEVVERLEDENPAPESEAMADEAES